ncbi:hypothetical protein OHA43_37880 [Streptomyces sp. NBC_00305]|uniref:hypothetical protein n=1 Tax=unclassified Streptomyces TaxID=2593676 RepID=UPI0022583EA2|nr:MULTISPECIES: hypothetical protein [unclassified Streptomyces]MCX5165026.1 hypothetical protein [Streptomyces sp. NBC_00305]
MAEEAEPRKPANALDSTGEARIFAIVRTQLRPKNNNNLHALMAWSAVSAPRRTTFPDQKMGTDERR